MKKISLIKGIVEFIDRNFHLVTTLPATIVVVLVVLFPAIFGLYTSFFVRNLLRQQFYFAGLGNYARLFQDPSFWIYLGHTVVYTAGAVALSFAVSLCLAVALASGVRFKAIFIAAILLPWMTPMVSGCIMWRWVLHDMYGILNFILIKLGVLSQPYFWLGERGSALFWLIIVESWYEIPLLTLILYAGTQRIPVQLYEAAEIDGGGAWQRFRAITLPMIKPEILIALVLPSMFAFRRFGIPFLLTGGGPGGATEILGLTIYKTANRFLQQGYGAAMSVVMFIIITAFVIGYFKAFRK